ncbi:MAG: hypothetical protein JXQ87_09905 [Bacteroidia bacterium]
MALNRIYIILGIISFSLSVYAQSPLLPTNSLSNYLLIRGEIASGKLNNKAHFNLQPMHRNDAGDYLRENKELFVYGSDSFNFRYLMNDNTGWAKEKVNTAKRKPFLGAFYKDPANLFALNQDKFQVFVNPVILYTQGWERESKLEDPIFKNERGLEVRGNLLHRLSFYTYMSENQARYPEYVRDYIRQYGKLPGEGFYKGFGDQGVDHYTARGHITFNAIEDHVQMTFGHGRNFIGNGIRSMILSDFAKDYLHLRINTKIWRFNYQNLYAELSDYQGYSSMNPRPLVYPKKYLAAHYLSLDLLKNLNFGIYEAVVFYDIDGSGRGYDINYLNPIIFYRALEHNAGASPDNVLMAATINYLPTKGLSLYGQYLIDEFKFYEMTSRDKWWGNKYSLQLGMHSVDLFDVKYLDYRLEYNMVRPYTYSHNYTGTNYVHFNQTLAHPLGANFKEIINQVKYMPVKNLFATVTYTYSTQGSDTAGYHFGSDVLELYANRPFEYGVLAGQGLTTNINTVFVELSYMLRHNFFIEFNMMLRNYKYEFEQVDRNDLVFNFGVRWNAVNKNLHF